MIKNFLNVLLLVTSSNAWTYLTHPFRRTYIVLDGSRAANKWERKQEWLRQRGGGIGETDVESGTAATSTMMSEIIGAGRIGDFLATAGECVVLGRSDAIDPERTGQPILIATRNDSLESIVENCPEHRRPDLVFLQNGYLDNFLREKNLLDNTQVLLYLSVTAKGAAPIDGVTAVNPEGLTTATGRHAQAFADRLAALNMKCKVVTPEEYRSAMFEKLIWISTYMLVGTAKECKTVGQASSEYRTVVEQMVNELVAAVAAKEGVLFSPGTMERLAAYTDVVADFPCGVKEFQWRNQYFYDLGNEMCPTHNALLRDCKEKGLINFDLP